MELVSPLLRTDFREFCVNYFVIRQINDIFTMAGVKRGKMPSDCMTSGQRRTLVEEYYASLNWRRQDDADRFLKILGYAIAQQYASDEPRQKLRALCEREGLIIDGIQVYFKAISPRSNKYPAVGLAALAELNEKLLALNKIEPHSRGFEFERFLKDLFDAHGLAPRSSFRLVGEQIDGSFEFNGDVYLLEAKWQAKPTSQADLLVFREKVQSKSTWTRGLFVSISGFSEEGLSAFARGRATNIIGMTGQDLYFILSGEISLTDAISRKVRRAAETGEFYARIFDLLRS
ncbi:MAG TPA: restriction endonuclease [Blastocatellia bacterium]|nr:restriction endonuclease [Blastocatellia bacterium]